MNQTMKAVVFEGKGRFALKERPVPALHAPTDAIVRVTLASICSSDLHIKHGSVPRAKSGVVVGHEMVGVVEQIGNGVRKVRAGDRVTVNVETFCGECYFCRRGFVNNCTHEYGGWALGCRIDGGQAEYVRVPFADHGLDVIPAGVTDEQALFTGDILATGYWGAGIGGIEEGDTVLVIGAGPTGLCTMACARLCRPARIIAADISEERLSLARRMGIADLTVNPAREDPGAAARSLTQGRGADVVFEAAGGADTFEAAWKAARPNGTVCVIAMYEKPQVLPLPDMYGKNLTFKTGGVDANSCGKILELVRREKLNTTPLITHRFSLDRALEAYALFESGADGVVKIALKP
ncbi:alcohol dehydrogenase [Christensenella minuta]|uniref:Putative alcohol dehydrogenase n=2 Tax=Christensenella minuta TaxID=626937 RepID=A0A136Q429_9FIRM|nr:alcohol dehydrogenase [Christensenella minuta]KXK65397.1 putative alcohol dehydrogenase [Christensenella minuta]